MPESGLTSQRSAVMTSAIESLRKARAFTASSIAQEQVAGGRQAVAADQEALDVGEVERGQNASRKRAFSASGSSPCASRAKAIARARLSRFARTCSSVWPP